LLSLLSISSSSSSLSSVLSSESGQWSVVSYWGVVYAAVLTAQGSRSGNLQAHSVSGFWLLGWRASWEMTRW
jgi:hypothetical protein